MPKKEDSIIQNYLKKIELLEKYNNFYYDKDSPLISDQQYDDLRKEIIKLEENNSFLKNITQLMIMLDTNHHQNLKK